MATMPSITFQPTVRYSSRSPRSRRRPRSALAVVSYKARLAAKPPLLRIAERHHPCTCGRYPRDGVPPAEAAPWQSALVTTVGQQAHWTATFVDRQDFLGAEPSEVGRAALARFRAARVDELLELGAGQGRDTLLFAGAGIRGTALDYAAPGLTQIKKKARASGVETSIRTLQADVRHPLPVANSAFDAGYAHMLLCMALTTAEIELGYTARTNYADAAERTVRWLVDHPYPTDEMASIFDYDAEDRFLHALTGMT